MSETVRAKRGDLVAFTVKHSSTGAFESSVESSSYETAHLSIVRSITMEGRVKSVDGSREFASPQIISRSRLRIEPEAIVAEVGKEFASLDDIREAVRRYLKDDRELALDALTPSVRATVRALQGGALLCKTMRPPLPDENEAEALWFLHPSNKRVTRSTAEAVVASTFAAPQADSLFDDGNAQTWRAA